MKNPTSIFLLRNKFSKIMFFSLTLFALSFVTNDAYADHLSEDMKWQLVYITHNSVCSNYDVQMTRTYFEITSSYLESYHRQRCVGVSP